MLEFGIGGITSGQLGTEGFPRNTTVNTFGLQPAESADLRLVPLVSNVKCAFGQFLS